MRFFAVVSAIPVAFCAALLVPDRGDGRVPGRAAAAETPAKAQPAGQGQNPKEGVVAITPKQIADQGISVEPVRGGAVTSHLLVPGTIITDPDRVARVPARVVGTVNEMRKRLGERVEKNEVVAVLDSREVADAKSEYLAASVKAELEKTNFDRQQGLWDKKISAEAIYLNAKAVYSEATLRQDLARQKLSALGLDAADVERRAKQEGGSAVSSLRQYQIRSPIAGRIVERKVDVGTAVGKEGDPADLYTVADLSGVWVELAVPTNDLDKVKEGAAVTVRRSQNGDGRTGTGPVVFVSPLLNLETRSARVVVALPNPNADWRPGTFVSAEVQVSSDQVTARVDRKAIQTVEGKKVVFVRTKDGFEKREVMTGRTDDQFVEIGSGLKEGEEIAVANTFLLKAELGKAEAEHGD